MTEMSRISHAAGLATFTLAAICCGSPRAAATDLLLNSTDSDAPQGSALGEIVVTAQKHEERLQDVPIPVTALGGEELAANNQVRIQDFYTQVPGLTIAPGSFTSPVIAIRGITTGSGTTASTVAIMVDGVPYGSSTHLIVPDFDPGDLARVEVLRGPQGTLYGTSSLGGLLNFITKDPSTSGVSGRVEAGTSTVYNGAQLGYTFRASGNFPLSSDLAVRVSAFTRLDPGYVDNPVLRIDGINKDIADGGHIVALWRPSDDFSMKLSALYQQTKGDGTSQVNVESPGYTGAPLGDLQQNYIAGVGPYAFESQAYSAVVNDKVGNLDLTSVSAYNVSSFRDSQDDTFGFGSFTQFGVPGTGFNGFGVAGTPIEDDARTSKYSQELRLSGTIVRHVDLLLGGFYTHEFTSASQSLLAENATTGAIVGQTLFTPFTSTYEEYAVFADLTYHFNDQFDVQFGGRESEIKLSFNEAYFGLYDMCCTPTDPYTQPPESARSRPFTYLVTPRFRFSSDLMMYARVASGYRAGGTNSAGLGVPPSYQPDKTKDYEIGAKGNLFDHAFSFDASVYYIDWTNIQLGLTNPTTEIGYGGNAGGAKSQGVELSAEARPLDGLKLGAWVAYNEAVLTEPLPPGPPGAVPYGVPGDFLPYASRWSGNLSSDLEIPVVGSWTAFAGGLVSFVGARQDQFTATPVRQYLPPYARTDFRAGAKYNEWTANIYVNNVTDRRGLISGGIGTGVPAAIYYITPRTVGISLARTF
jgi:iron complex outermembrane recepter protein